MSLEFSSQAHITQSLKRVMAKTPGWASLQDDQKEALEVIAREITQVLHSDPGYAEPWATIAGLARLVNHRLENDRDASIRDASVSEEPKINQVNRTAATDAEAEHPTCLICGKAHKGAVTSFFVDMDEAESNDPALAAFKQAVEEAIRRDLQELMRSRTTG